jgi:hypothetical protein
MTGQQVPRTAAARPGCEQFAPPLVPPGMYFDPNSGTPDPAS